MEQNFSSKLLERAVEEVSNLPGIGRKTALRLVLHLLRQDATQTNALSEALTTLRREVRYCRVCHNISDTETCQICSNPKRDSTTLCVVENVQDVMAIEATNMFNGLYHVLGVVISPLDGIGPSNLHIQSLTDRVPKDQVREVILALSPTMEGDTTAYFIYRRLMSLNIPELKVTVIARGVAQNNELQYTDEATLGRALAGRTPFVGN